MNELPPLKGDGTDTQEDIQAWTDAGVPLPKGYYVLTAPLRFK